MLKAVRQLSQLLVKSNEVYYLMAKLPGVVITPPTGRPSKPKLMHVISEDRFFCLHLMDRALAARHRRYDVVAREQRALPRTCPVYRRGPPDVPHYADAKPIPFGSPATIASPGNAAIAGMGYVFSARERTAQLLRRCYCIVLNPRRSALMFDIRMIPTISWSAGPTESFALTCGNSSRKTRRPDRLLWRGRCALRVANLSKPSAAATTQAHVAYPPPKALLEGARRLAIVTTHVVGRSYDSTPPTPGTRPRPLGRPAHSHFECRSQEAHGSAS